MKAEPGQRLNSQLLEPSAFAIWNIHLASRRRLIAWRGAGLVNVRFWPKVDVRGGRWRRPLVMSAFDGGFNWSMQQLVDIARSVSGSPARLDEERAIDRLV